LQALILADGGLEPGDRDARPDFDSLLVFQITFVKALQNLLQKQIYSLKMKRVQEFQNIFPMRAALGR
jgi:hypothetical protein